MLRFICTLAVLCGAAVGRGDPPSSAPASARSTDPQREIALWLIDAARHHGHLVGRDDARRVTLHVLSLMKAASEVDPTCPAAWPLAVPREKSAR